MVSLFNGGFLSYYTETNFKSKKALKEAVAAGQSVEVWAPSSAFGFGGTAIAASKVAPVKVYLEGPHYPKPHNWYGSAMILNGIIIPGTVK